MIRRANKDDIQGLIHLLYQADAVHHGIRPDLFKGNTPKYSEQDLQEIVCDDSKPIFVYDDGDIRGHAFCQILEVRNHRLLQDIKTLYIDDICIDEHARGQRIGTALFDHVRAFAQAIGCYNITLNVWDGNDAALNFYHSVGMKVQKTGMEVIL